MIWSCVSGHRENSWSKVHIFLEQILHPGNDARTMPLKYYFCSPFLSSYCLYHLDVTHDVWGPFHLHCPFYVFLAKWKTDKSAHVVLLWHYVMFLILLQFYTCTTLFLSLYSWISCKKPTLCMCAWVLRFVTEPHCVRHAVRRGEEWLLVVLANGTTIMSGEVGCEATRLPYFVIRNVQQHASEGVLLWNCK